MIERLYGRDGDEYLQSDPEEVWELWYDSGTDQIFTDIIEWSTSGYEQFTPHASRVAEWVGEMMCDADLGFEEGADKLMEAVGSPEVIVAFDAAIKVLVDTANEQGWAFADKKLRTGQLSTAMTDDGPQMMLIWDES